MTERVLAGLLLRPVLAAVLGGAVCGVVGVWVTLLNIPFVGVALSHAAFAGAVLGLLLGVNPLLAAVVASIAAALFIGPLAERADVEPGVSLGIVFSLVLGLAFLGLGFLPGPRTEALRYVWGSILLVRWSDVALIAAAAGLVLGFLVLFEKEITAVLFSREIARAVGVRERLVLFLMLACCGLAVTANLNTIGGLLVFSLIVNPPSAAAQLTWRLRWRYGLSALFGVISCLAGLVVSWLTDAPSGAAIVICSSLIFGLTLLFSPRQRAGGM